MKHSRRRLVQAVVLVLVLSVASCTPGQESGPVTIGVRTSNCQTPFYVADRQGLYEKRGVEVTVQLVPTNTEIIEAMKAGVNNYIVKPFTPATLSQKIEQVLQAVAGG